MSKYKFVNLIDKLFVSVCIFLLLFAWINYFLRSLWTSFLLSIVFAISTTNILYYFLNKKQTRQLSFLQNKQEIEEQYFNFRMMPEKDKLTLIKKVLGNEHDVTLKNGFLNCEEQDKKCVWFIYSRQEKLTEDDLINVLCEVKDYDELNIICGVNQTYLKFENKTINIIDKQQLYENYFKKYNAYPPQSKLKQNEKFSLKTVFKNFIKKEKSKSYFICGLILIFSSIILPYRYYYIIFGSAFLTLAIICKFFPNT